MTIETQIINDLHVSQSTAHSIAGRLNRSVDGINTMLLRMEKDGRVTRRTICDGRLTVWLPSRAQKEEE